MQFFQRKWYCKLLIVSILIISTILIIHYVVKDYETLLKKKDELIAKKVREALNIHTNYDCSSPLYVWSIFTDVDNTVLRYSLSKKFRYFLSSMFYYSHCNISLNIITDSITKPVASSIISNVLAKGPRYNKIQAIEYYDIAGVFVKLKPISEIMKPYFSSAAGTYYNNALFYISLDLHEIAPEEQKNVIILDIDIVFESSITELNKMFEQFTSNQLFGLGPELSPVYYHALWKYRAVHPYVEFGMPHSEGGFPGLNSGVVLLRLDEIKKSKVYNQTISEKFLQKTTEKYSFKGSLGDQDFYTILWMEHPELIYILPCTWNRQMCEWWSTHGYADVFDRFAKCVGVVNIYHTNCNSSLPKKRKENPKFLPNS